MNRHLRVFTIFLASLAVAACNQYREVEEAVRHNMLDPEAAQFRELSTCSADSSVYHGEVNAKNAMGAYTGFKPFYYADGGVYYAENAKFSELIDRCHNAPTATTASEPAAVDAALAASAAAADAARAANSAASLPLNGAPERLTPAGGTPNIDDDTTEDLLKRNGDRLRAATAKTAPRCWQDYCPCDTSDPDYGGADTVICRNLKGGLPVDDEMMASGAGLRDARRQLREFEEAN